MKVLAILLLIGAASGIHIGCNFNMRAFSHVGTIYACEVRSIDLSNNSTHISGYNGTHLSGNSSTNVGAIHIFGCAAFNLTTFPRRFSNIFPNIVAFEFRGCAFNILVGDELEEYPNLRHFRSWPGQLVRIPGNLFALNPNLRFLCLDSNRIQHVGESLLNHLNFLTEIHFSNPCLSRSIANPSELPAFIQALHVNCPDIETTTQSTTLTTTTSTVPITTTFTVTSTTLQPSRCEIENLEDFVCGLDEENENLRERVQNLEEVNQEFRWKFAELERKVLDLSSRPCAC